jgi:hypothetical protein
MLALSKYWTTLTEAGIKTRPTEREATQSAIWQDASMYVPDAFAELYREPWLADALPSLASPETRAAMIGAVSVHRVRSAGSTKGPRYPENNAWPVLMRADMAAAYVDERSATAFIKGVGKIYPHPVRGRGRRGVWSKASLDACAGNDVTDELADLI